MARSGLIRVRRRRPGFLQGIARSGSGRPGKILASFLQSDVQGDLAHAQALLAEIAGIERGEAPQPAAVGNAFSITIAADGAVIRNIAVEGALPQRVGFGDLRAALETWIAAIERSKDGGG
jgi:hypothetical protein